MTEQNNNYKYSTQDSKEVVMGQLTYGKLLFLVVVTFILSGFGPLTFFAPVPMAIAYLIYGKTKTLGVSIAAFIGVAFAFTTSPESMAFMKVPLGIFVLVNLFGFLVSRIIATGKNPAQGIVKYGGAIIVGLLLILGAVQLSSDLSLFDQVTSLVAKMFNEMKETEDVKAIFAAGGEQAAQLKQILSRPEEAVKSMFEWSFSVTVIGVFFSLWISLFMVLRNQLIWKGLYDYPYKLKDLVNFKTPDYMIYILLVGMISLLSGDYTSPVVPIIGSNIIWSLGVFYFFQGFGCYLAFLDSIGIKGFFRTMLTIFTIFVGYQLVALVGVLDLFFDFKLKLKKKEVKEI